MNVKINASIDFIGIVVLLVVLVSQRKSKWQETSAQRLFTFLLLITMLILTFDIPAWLLNGVTFPGARILCYILDSLYYAFQITFLYVFLLFSETWIVGLKKRNASKKLLIKLPLIIELCLIAINPWTGWVFTINSSNTYLRGSQYLANLLPYCVYILVIICRLLKSHSGKHGSEAKHRSLSLLGYMFLPLCGALLESHNYGYSWVWPFTALTILMIHNHIQEQNRLNDQLRIMSVKNDLTNAQTAIMLSQIQPHFLFNSLSAIAGLCEQDAGKAQQAIVEFAQYLRLNLDSLSNNELVSFAQEQQHVEVYLRLEKMRFEELLDIEWDIQAKSFVMPRLTLQPLVENAVRYGIYPREEGGKLKISTHETDSCYEVCVEDNGNGFDVHKLPDDGKSHIGIENVRKRLESQCNSTLDIISQPGKGTRAIIRIHKTIEESHEDHCN